MKQARDVAVYHQHSKHLLLATPYAAQCISFKRVIAPFSARGQGKNRYQMLCVSRPPKSGNPTGSERGTQPSTKHIATATPFPRYHIKSV
jgi:hypothetical protein